MAASERSLGGLLLREIKDLFIYHRDQMKTLAAEMFIMFISTAVLAHAWRQAWIDGVAWDVFRILVETFSVNPATILIIPVGFFMGLLFLFVFDDYKRIQGIFLFSAAFLGIGAIKMYFGALDDFNWFAPPTLTAGLVSGMFGTLYGGLIKELTTEGLNEFKRGFQRFTFLVGVVGIFGIADAIIKERIIQFNRNDPSTVGSLTIPAKFEWQIIGLQSEPNIAVISLIVYSGALFLLIYILIDFNSHDLEKTILILGPDRAGKTWFMGGAGYCLMEEAIEGARTVDPDLNPPLNEIRVAFANRDFDSGVLKANDPGEYGFFKFQYRHGFIKRQRVTVRTVDYAGEHLKYIKWESDEAWNEFTDEWEYDSVPTFEQLQDDKEQGNIDLAHLPSLLSVLAAEADLLGLVLPMYDFAEELDDVQLPHHIEQSDLKNYRRTRVVPSHIRGKQNQNGYLEVYAGFCSNRPNNEYFFLGTMSDVFLKTYSISGQGTGLPLSSWDPWREHVWEYVTEMDQFDPGANFNINNHEYLYPVYFEPEKGDSETQGGQFKPKLDWDDDYYALRGLQYVLERMGR